MAKIHGLVYIALGLFVSIFSWIVNFERFVFFFYIGILIVIYGVAKAVIDFIRRGNATEAKKSISQREKHYLMQQQLSQRAKQQYKYCSKCKNIVRIHDRFCSRCGARV